MTTSVCHAAAATLALLTHDLEPGERAESRDRSGLHMPLFVERLQDAPAGSLFVVTHYYRGREPIPTPRSRCCDAPTAAGPAFDSAPAIRRRDCRERRRRGGESARRAPSARQARRSLDGERARWPAPCRPCFS